MLDWPNALSTGNTVTDTLAAVLDRDPDWSALSEAIPLVVRRLLRRCLAKDVRQRLQHIGDARLELEETEPRANDSSAGARRSSPNVLALSLGALLLVRCRVRARFWPRGGQTSAPATTPVSLTLKIESAAMGELELPVNAFYVPFAISPDGARVVFRARGRNGSQLFLRDLSGFDAKPLPGTEMATSPFFSADGRWIGFWRAEDRILRKVSTTGGAPLEIAPTDAPHIALWRPDGEIVIETAVAQRVAMVDPAWRRISLANPRPRSQAWGVVDLGARGGPWRQRPSGGEFGPRRYLARDAVPSDRKATATDAIRRPRSGALHANGPPGVHGRGCALCRAVG